MKFLIICALAFVVLAQPGGGGPPGGGPGGLSTPSPDDATDDSTPPPPTDDSTPPPPTDDSTPPPPTDDSTPPPPPPGGGGPGGGGPGGLSDPSTPSPDDDSNPPPPPPTDDSIPPPNDAEGTSETSEGESDNCENNQPTSNENAILVAFYRNDAGGEAGDDCPVACEGEPLIQTYYKVVPEKNGAEDTCYGWPGNAGHNSGKHGVCEEGQSYSFTQWTDCECGESDKTSINTNDKHFYVEKCVVETPNTLCAKIIDYSACETETDVSSGLRVSQSSDEGDEREECRKWAVACDRSFVAGNCASTCASVTAGSLDAFWACQKSWCDGNDEWVNKNCRATCA